MLPELLHVQQEHFRAEAMLNLYSRRPNFIDMSPTATPTFRHQISIAQKDIDDMGHVNNAVYVRWVQEAVVQYWKHVSPAHAQAQLLWVALKHEITYRTPLVMGDQVTALVTATATRGSRASFTTQFWSGVRMAAEARSSWCCVDATTRRPRRIADEIATLFLPAANT